MTFREAYRLRCSGATVGMSYDPPQTTTAEEKANQDAVIREYQAQRDARLAEEKAKRDAEPKVCRGCGGSGWNRNMGNRCSCMTL